MTSSKAQSPIEISRPASGEKRLTELGITLSASPELFGIYVDADQRGNLPCLTGMFRTQGREAKFIGCVGAELHVHTGSEAAQLAAPNAIAVARNHLGSLDKVTWILRPGVLVATSGASAHERRSPTPLGVVAKGFRQRQKPCRFGYGVASLPLGAPNRT
jgi:hypothetical protein